MASPPGEAQTSSGPPDLKRYLPHAVVATALVVLLPAFVVSLIEPKGEPAMLLFSVPLAMGLSIVVAATLSALWSRQRGSVDLVFGELMLWGWWRRYQAEKRLSQAVTLIGKNVKAIDFDGPEGSFIEGTVERINFQKAPNIVGIRTAAGELKYVMLAAVAEVN